MKFFSPEILVQDDPCIIEQKAVNESLSGRCPDFKIPVKVT